MEKESIFGKLHDLAADIEEREGEEVCLRFEFSRQNYQRNASGD